MIWCWMSKVLTFVIFLRHFFLPCLIECWLFTWPSKSQSWGEYKELSDCKSRLWFSPFSLYLEVNVPVFHLCRCFPPGCRKKWVIPSNSQPLELNSPWLPYILLLMLKKAFNNFIWFGQLKSMLKVTYFRMFDLNSVHCIDIGVMMICQQSAFQRWWKKVDYRTLRFQTHFNHLFCIHIQSVSGKKVY